MNYSQENQEPDCDEQEPVDECPETLRTGEASMHTSLGHWTSKTPNVQNFARIRMLFLDDNDERHRVVEKQAVDLYASITHAHTIQEFTDLLRRNEPFDVISLDHDLGDFQYVSEINGREATGQDACNVLLQHPDKIPPLVLIHSVNPVGARSMQQQLALAGVRVRWLPFFY